jgi:ATP-binding cassette subfamily C protein CydD
MHPGAGHLARWHRRTGGAATMRAALRKALHAPLLRSRLTRGRLIGEDMHLAVDAIADTDGLSPASCRCAWPAACRPC